MVTSKFQLPIFFNGLNDEQKSVLITRVFTSLAAHGVTQIHSVASDEDTARAAACKDSRATMNCLLKDFKHPNIGHPIYPFYDPVPMAKLVQNFFALKGSLFIIQTIQRNL